LVMVVNLRYLLLIGLVLSIVPVSADNSVASWGYQLQNYNLNQLQQSSYDLLVLDYSKDGSDEEAFTFTELNTIRAENKILLSYISIGEAEDYRSYFNQTWHQNPPEWLGDENPDWEGNYKVHFWDEHWQSIVFEYLDKIIAQGFDGVYLDIIDAYEYYQADYADADQWMIDFVISIANYTRSEVSDFLIVPQNGDPLLVEDRYRNVIDGIGREDTFILPDEQKLRSHSELAEIEKNLDLLINDGKLVLTVDYSDDTELITSARQAATAKGYIPYIGPLDLDTLYSPDYTGQDKTMPLAIVPAVIAIGVIVWVKIVRGNYRAKF